VTGVFDRVVRRFAILGIALAAISLLASLVLVVYSVVMRYFLNQPAAWVDELLGQQQVVVKNLESNYGPVDHISGATIMGDGRVALILDVAALVRRARH